MTKKGIIFIIFVASIISIMLIAVWGTLPENTNAAAIDYLEFIEYDGYNEDEEKVKDVKDIVSETSPNLLLKYNYGPDDAYAEIVISLTHSGITYQHDSISKEIYIYYTLDAIQKEEIIIVSIKDQRTQKQDMIILWFQPPGVIIVPDL